MPPKLYGGTERVVSYLTEELVRLGHEVTLFASGDSRDDARSWSPACPRALWRDADCRETLPHHVRLMELVFADVSRFDVIHFHCDYLHFPLLRRYPCPSVTTLHGRLHVAGPGAACSRSTPRCRWSRSPTTSAGRSPRPTGRRPSTTACRATCTPSASDPATTWRSSAACLPRSGVDRAIEIARRAGMTLKIAAKIYPEERAYFERDRSSRCCASRDRWVEFVGEVGGREKDEFLGNAHALLFPIDWPEPFGLVMIEAMACGTPVIAWRNGSVPEVIDDGVTGFVVDTSTRRCRRSGASPS